MKIDDPSKLKPGTVLVWHDGDTVTVENVTWGAVVVRWNDGTRRVYPFDDNIWHYFKTYGKEPNRNEKKRSAAKSERSAAP